MVSREAWKTSGFLRGVGIPAPSGQFTVGCVDLMQQMKEGEEDVFVRLFYPTTTPAGEVSTDRYALWYPHKNYIKGYLHYTKIKAIGLFAYLHSTLLTPRSPTIISAPLYSETTASSSSEEGASAVEPSTFPVIVYSHGLGTMRTTYSGICSDLASRGYVVAAVEHRDLSACATMKLVPGGAEGELVDQWTNIYLLAPNEEEFPLRNKQVLQRASEVSRALDLLTLLNDGGEIHDKMGSSFDFSQFKGRLDVSRPAVMGHSFGGATTVQTLSNDSRFKCGIALDTWMVPLHNDIYDKGIEQPLLFINSYDFQWKENVQNIMKLVKPPNESGMSTCRMVTIIDSNHFNQADVQFVMPAWFCRLTTMLSRLDPVVAHQVNQEVSYAFLKRHQLRDPDYQQPIPNLDGTEGHSEHILFGTNVDLSENEAQEPSVNPSQESPQKDKIQESPGEQEDTKDKSQELTGGDKMAEKSPANQEEKQKQVTADSDAKNELVSGEEGTAVGNDNGETKNEP